MKLKTERLLIRRPCINDADSYQKIRNSSFVLQYNPMQKRNMAQVQDELKTASASEDVFFLETLNNSTLVGMVYLDEDSIRFGVDSLEISFFIDEQYSGNGYMHEALSAILGNIFSTRSIALITARSFAENKKSINLLKKIGFQQDGYIRRCVKCRDIIYDDVLFSITKEENECNVDNFDPYEIV